LAEHRESGAQVTILSFEPRSPLPYGRVIRDPSGAVRGIVEDKDATDEQRAITELNSSIYVFDADALWPALEQLEARNVQGELYLTDAVERIVAAGGTAAAYCTADADAPLGINTRAELALAAAHLRDRVNEGHMLAG